MFDKNSTHPDNAVIHARPDHVETEDSGRLRCTNLGTCDNEIQVRAAGRNRTSVAVAA